MAPGGAASLARPGGAAGLAAPGGAASFVPAPAADVAGATGGGPCWRGSWPPWPSWPGGRAADFAKARPFRPGVRVVLRVVEVLTLGGVPVLLIALP